MTGALSVERRGASAAEMARMLSEDTDASRSAHGSAGSQAGSIQAPGSGVALQVNPVMLLKKPEDDRAVSVSITEASAQCTLELLMRVLPHGNAQIAPGVELELSALCAQPVPMALIVRIVGAVCAHTGFGNGAFSDDVGAAVLRTVDPDGTYNSCGPSRNAQGEAHKVGSEMTGTQLLSLPAAKLQFFQRLSAEIRRATHESTSASPSGTSAEQVDPEARATARAIVVELQPERAPLALNEFLQELARAALKSSGSALATPRAAPPATPQHEPLVPPLQVAGAVASRRSHQDVVLGTTTDTVAVGAIGPVPHAQDEPVTVDDVRVLPRGDSGRSKGVVRQAEQPESVASTATCAAASLTGSAKTDESQPAPKPGQSAANKSAGLQRFQALGRKVNLSNRISSVLNQEASAPVQIHVRGVGGKFEVEEALVAVFEQFGAVIGTMVRHRIDKKTGANTSWALITMENKAGADAVIAGAASLPKPLTVTRFSKKQADASKGAMSKIRRQAAKQVVEKKIQKRNMSQKLRDEDRLKINSETSDRTFVEDSKKKLKLGVTSVMIGRTMIKASEIDDDIKADIFARFDQDGGGVLDFRELRQALRALGIEESVEQLRSRMKAFDTDGDEEIDYGEFSQMVNDIISHQKGNSTAVTQLQLMQKSMDNGVSQASIGFSDHAKSDGAGPRYIRRPESAFSLSWDVTQMMLLIYVAFSVTLTIGFDMRENSPSDWMFWLEVAVDLYFLADLVLQFFTSYIDSRGMEIVQLKAIAGHYVGFPLKGSTPRWFWLDCASGFPLNYIMMAIGNEEAASSTSNLRTMKIARMAKLLKLLRIARAGRILKRHEDTIMPLIVIHGLTIVLFFSMHCLACFWFLAGLTDNGGNCLSTSMLGEDLDCGRGWVIKRGWRDSTDANGQPCYIGDSVSDCPMGIVSLNLAYTMSLSDIFMRNVDPETNAERLFVILAEIVISMMFGAIAGVIFSQISSMRTTQESYNARLTELKEFASARGLPTPLRLRLLAFHRFLYEGGTVFDEKAILSELPLHMQRDVVYGIYGDIIMKSYFFLGIQHNDSAVMRICQELEATAALPGDDIYREGDIGDHMFFLLQGEVQQTTQCLELELDGLNQSKEEQEDEAACKPHAQLIIKWQFGNVEEGTSDEALFRKAFMEKNEKSSTYNVFRDELGTVSGIFVPTSRMNARTSYKQTRSEVQVELEQQTGTAKDLSLVHSQWTLEFDAGCAGWILSNAKLRGTWWTDKDQLPYRPPLGTETMWKWQWREEGSQYKTLPDKYLPLQCLVYVELVSPPLCFGELEMMRIGGGACGCGGGSNWCGKCGRTRTMTAKAMTESRMCRLSADAFETLRTLYPQHMGNNRNFALRKAAKKDPQSQSHRRKLSTKMLHPGPGDAHSERRMTASVDSLDARATGSYAPSGSGGYHTPDAMHVELAAFKESVMQEVKAEIKRGHDEIKELLAQMFDVQRSGKTNL